MQPTAIYLLISLSLALAARAVVLQRRRRLEAKHAVLLNQALVKMRDNGWATAVETLQCVSE